MPDKCPKCNHEVEPTMTYCPKCGEGLQAEPQLEAKGIQPVRLATEYIPLEKITVEIQKNARLIKDEAGVLKFCVTNLSQKRLRVSMKLGIMGIKMENMEERYEVTPEQRQAIFSFQLYPDKAGQFKVIAFSVIVENLDDRKDVMAYTLPDGALVIGVARDEKDVTQSVNLTINVGTGIVDIAKIQDFINTERSKSSQRDTSISQAEWQLLNLVYDAKRTNEVKGRKPTCSFRLINNTWEHKIKKAKFVFEHEGVLYKIFLLPGREFNFGRKCHPDGGKINDIVLNLLPYEDESLELRSNQISRFHGCFKYKDGKMYVVDKSKFGIEVNGKQIPKETEFLLDDTCRISIPHSAVLNLDLRVIRPPLGEDIPEFYYEDTKLPEETAHISIYKELRIDAVRIHRDNWDQHMYVLLFKHATIGRNPNCAIWLPFPSVADYHAHLYYYSDEGQYVLVGGARDEGITEVEGHQLTEDTACVLYPGMKIRLNELTLSFQLVRQDDFLEA